MAEFAKAQLLKYGWTEGIYKIFVGYFFFF